MSHGDAGYKLIGTVATKSQLVSYGMDISNKKIALVHDYLLRIGGAERVLKVLHEMFPHAPIYTVVYDEKFVENFFSSTKLGPGSALIKATFLQKLPKFLRKRYKYFSFLIPSAVENLDLSAFDIVISSSSAFSKGIITRPDTIHICYCHTPTRFLWDWTHEYNESLREKRILGFFAKLIIHFMRFWDRQASSRVDYFIANSKHVAARIKKYYDRDAKVIYPPVEMGLSDNTLSLSSAAPARPPQDLTLAPPDCGRETMPASGSKPAKEYYLLNSLHNKEFFLIVSQLRPYKQIDIAVEAFKKLEFPLVIIGEGDDKKRLKELAKGFDNVVFLGYQTDEVVEEYYRNCKAFIFPGEEDFGIAMVEAMLHGKPVLARRIGGAKEIVVEGMTGEFFDEPHHVVLADGVRRLLENYKAYSPLVIKRRAEKFSCERFKREMLEFIDKYCIIESYNT